MEEDVTDVIEESLNTIAGLRSLNSQTVHGISQVYAEFELGADIDIAAQDVRDKLSLARFELPTDLDPPVVQKVDTSGFPVMWIPIVSSGPAVETSEYVRLELKPALETLVGVGAVEVIGRLDRNIRIWLDGAALRARGLTPIDVSDALAREHVEIPGGQVVSDRMQYSVNTAAEFRSLAELERLIVAHRGGAPIHLSDIARVEDGSEDVEASAYYNGTRTVGIGVLKRPGANTVAIVERIYERLERLSKTAPEGIAFGRSVGTIDFAAPIREAVAETQFALVLGALLATLTVFAFLRRWRPTLIVGAAIPLSLVGSFGAMWLFGFTLNVMTLLALAVAVGVVIDDAIVVLENIERHRERGEGAFEAASKGTREIAFAATAATLSIAIVFLPVMFASGIVGNFLREFGGTVASAVMISLFVALTLTPMLAARMAPPAERAHGSIYHRLELGFLWLERRYAGLLDWGLGHRRLVLTIAVGALALSGFFASRLGVEFFPPEDQGRVVIKFDLPAGGTVAASEVYVGELYEWLEAQPEILGTFVGIGVTGPDSPASPNQGIMFNILCPREERERSAQQIIEAARSFVATLPDARANISGTESMSQGMKSGLAFDIRGRLALDELAGLADEMIRGMEEQGGFVDVDRGLKLGLPEVRVVPDREKAAAGAVGDRYALADTALKTCPLLLTGLAVAIAFRAGVWNIGAEGQLLVGALAATAAGSAAAALPTPFPAVVALGAGMVAGAAWGGLAALLRVTRNVSEVIGTIMLNFVALRLVGWAVQGPLMEQAARYPQSDPLPAAALLPILVGRVHAGTLLAGLAAMAVWVVLFRTAVGFRWRAVGANPRAAAVQGFDPNRAIVSVMLASGALAGAAGAIEVLGVTGRLYGQFSAGHGYTAIAVALLARLHPGGVVVAALLFGALAAGAGAMQRVAGVPAVFVSIVQAVTVFAVLALEAVHAPGASTPRDVKDGAEAEEGA